MRHARTGPRKRKDGISWRKVLNDDEQQQLMVFLRKNATSLSDRRLFLICDILLNTGLRIQELAKLRVQDTPGVLGENVIEVYKGKGNKDRTIPISKRLATAIDKYISKIRPKTLPRHIRRSDISKPLFYSSRKKTYLQTVRAVDKKTGEISLRPRASTSLFRMIKGRGEAAGIKKSLHPHMFRHTFAVNSLRSKDEGGAGIDIYSLQNLMGHSSLETTVQYLHFLNIQANGMGERLDRDYSDRL